MIAVIYKSEAILWQIHLFECSFPQSNLNSTLLNSVKPLLLKLCEYNIMHFYLDCNYSFRFLLCFGYESVYIFLAAYNLPLYNKKLALWF